MQKSFVFLNHFVSKKWSSTKFWNLRSVLSKLLKHDRTYARVPPIMVTKRQRTSLRIRTDKPNGKMSHEKLTPKEKTPLTSNVNRGGGLVINESLCNKFGWIKWATKIGVCHKCAGKGHRMAECIAGENPSEKLNTMDHVSDKNVDSGIDIDYEYFCTIHDRKDILMYYHCEINKVEGTALADTA